MQDHVLQPLILNNKNKHVTFGNKHEQVFHEFLLPQILFCIRSSIAKMICDDPITTIDLCLDFSRH